MSEQDIEKIIADHTAFKNENTILKEQLALVPEQLEWLNKQVFGRKREQTSVIMDDRQLSLMALPMIAMSIKKNPDHML